MKQLQFAIVALLCLMTLGVNRAIADLAVGGKPDIHFKTIDNKTFDNKSLEGWIVAVVFWSSDDEWMLRDDLPLLKLQHDFHLRGVQFITVNVDPTMTDLRNYIADKKVTAPVVYESKGKGGPLPTAWGISRYPWAVVLGPDGTVITMTHPSKLDSALANALAKTPPKLSKEVLTDLAVGLVKDSIDSLEAHKDKKDYRPALQNLEYINKDTANETPVLVAAAKLLPYFFDTGVEADRQSLMTYKQAYPKGTAVLEIFKKLAPAAAKAAAAAAKPRELSPADRKAAAAKTKLAAADALEDAHKRIQAYKAYKQIVDHYKETDAAQIAAAKIKGYEEDEKFMAEVRLAAVEEEAKSMLAMAKNYHEAGNDEMANKTFTEIIAKFPGTPWAEQAQAGLVKPQ